MSSLRLGRLLVGLTVVVWSHAMAIAAELPEAVASHFSHVGTADGTMTKPAHLCLWTGMLVFSCALGFLPIDRLSQHGHHLNLPNKAYWLMPAHREELWAILDHSMKCFAALLVLFLAVVHFLVVQANEQSVPHLDVTGIKLVIMVFLMATCMWMMVSAWRLRRPR